MCVDATPEHLHLHIFSQQSTALKVAGIGYRTGGEGGMISGAIFKVVQ
jgi:hypothetical protein